MACRVTNKGYGGEILDVDQMIRKFNKAVDKAGILKDLRKHECFLSKSLRRKEKSKQHQIELHRKNK